MNDFFELTLCDSTKEDNGTHTGADPPRPPPNNNNNGELEETGNMNNTSLDYASAEGMGAGDGTYINMVRMSIWY